MEKMMRFYRKVDEQFEYCFNIQTEEPFTLDDIKTLIWLLSETFEPEKFGQAPFLTGECVVEIGPRIIAVKNPEILPFFKNQDENFPLNKPLKFSIT